MADTNANGLDAIPKYGTNRIAIDPRKVFGLEMSNGLCVKRSSSARAIRSGWTICSSKATFCWTVSGALPV